MGQTGLLTYPDVTAVRRFCPSQEMTETGNQHHTKRDSSAPKIRSTAVLPHSALWWTTESIIDEKTEDANEYHSGPTYHFEDILSVEGFCLELTAKPPNPKSPSACLQHRYVRRCNTRALELQWDTHRNRRWGADGYV